jgi:3-hydroxybutyryl-CoA dehydratase
MFLEEFKEAAHYATNGRTITEADSVLFSTLTGAYNPLFVDEVYASKTAFKTRIVPGLLTASICTGLIYQLPVGLFGEGFVALVGSTIKWTKAVLPGDTVKSHVTVVGKKTLADNRGLVTLKAKAVNQNNDEVLEIEYRIIVQAVQNGSS